MNFPLIGFVATVTIFSYPVCWLIRFSEKRIVGVKSEFWDAFLVAFLATIGTTVTMNLLLIMLFQVHWTVYNMIDFLFSICVYTILIRAFLKHPVPACIKIASICSIVLFAFGFALGYFGIMI